MIASINPAGVPALTVAGILFVTFYVLAALWVWRHRQELFGPDKRVDGDRRATRYLQIIAICAPLLLLSGRVLWMLIGLWIK